MWLPKDERRLLAAFYVKLKGPENESRFHDDDLVNVLNACRSKWKAIAQNLEHVSDPDAGPKVQQVAKLLNEDGGKKYEDLKARLDIAIRAMQKRGLIESKAEGQLRFTRCVSLTIDGYDLGRQYGRWLISSGLWFAEYRNHWVWLIVGFLGGVLGTLIVQWLTISRGK